MMDDGMRRRCWSGRAWARGAAVALAFGALSLVACGSSSTSSPTATLAAPTAAASPTPDATALATLAAGSAAAALAPVVVNLADYPAGFEVKKQTPRVVAAADVPGLPAPGSAYFATVATADGSEFVNIIAVVASTEADAAACLTAFVPDTYLPGLTSGAANATSQPENPAGAPAGAKAFSYTGAFSATQGGAITQHEVAGLAMAWVRGKTFVVVVGASYGTAPRTADVAHVAAAVDGRLSAMTN